MTPRCLYLVSSSASREYVADCLEALALPRQAVHHFRYLITYIDDALRKTLRRVPGRLPRVLQNLPVVVVYLYQEQTGGTWKPAATSSEGSYLPLRCGRLVEAFLEGEVAHFYFEVTDYVKPKVGNSTSRALLNQKIYFHINHRKKSDLSYAHVAEDLKLGAPAVRDAFAFQRFVASAYQPNEWRTRSLGNAPLDVTYDVVFLRVTGIFRERGNYLSSVRAVRRDLIGNPVSEYQLEVGATYHLQIATRLRARLPAELPGQGSAMLRLVFDPNVFRPAGPTSFRISSTYDLHYWSIVPTASQPQRAVLTIACDHNLPFDREYFVRKELICPEVSLLVSLSSHLDGGHRKRP